MKWSRKYMLVAGLGIIFLTNMLVFVGVSWNRSGEPDSILRLSERELRYSAYGKENSGFALSLNVQNLRYCYLCERYEISQERLIKLGLIKPQQHDLPYEENNDRRSRLEKPILVVLEFNGPAYQKHLAKARRNLNALRQEANKQHADTMDNKDRDDRLKRSKEHFNELLKESRLYIVDVGLDKNGLRKIYPDRQRYAIVSGVMRINDRRWKSGDKVAQISAFSGEVIRLNITKINVPLEWREETAFYSEESHFEAEIAWGSRLEPWLKKFEIFPAQKEKS